MHAPTRLRNKRAYARLRAYAINAPTRLRERAYAPTRNEHAHTRLRA